MDNVLQQTRRGRPPKYREGLATAICDRLKDGCTRTAAAECLGVHRDTLREWMLTYPAFSDMVTRAEAAAEVMFTAALADAARGNGVPKDWRAGETWLKRRRRADYGDTLDIRQIPKETVLEILKAQMQQDAIPEDMPAIESAEDVL